MAASSSHPPHRLGASGERIARRRLERDGWRVLASNYRFGRREVDLVARRAEVLAFIEVKTRSKGGYGGPEGAVDWRKRREIEAVARDFLLRSEGIDGLAVRFDVIAIEVDRSGGAVRYDHHEDAWRPGWR